MRSVPEVIEAALSRAVERLTTPDPKAGQERKALEARRRKIEQELAHLTAAVAVGGPVSTLVSAIKAAEVQRGQIDDQLSGLDGRLQIASLDRERIERDLRKRLNDWRSLLRRHVPQARQILRKLLTDRVVFSPQADHYTFESTWTLGKLVSGVVDLPQRMASPRGLANGWNRVFQGFSKAA